MLVAQSYLTLRDPMDCVARQAPLSMGFSRQECWSGWPCPPPGDLPNPGIKPKSSALQADSFPSEPPGKPKTKYYMKFTTGTSPVIQWLRLLTPNRGAQAQPLVREQDPTCCN